MAGFAGVGQGSARRPGPSQSGIRPLRCSVPRIRFLARLARAIFGCAGGWNSGERPAARAGGPEAPIPRWQGIEYTGKPAYRRGHTANSRGGDGLGHSDRRQRWASA